MLLCLLDCFSDTNKFMHMWKHNIETSDPKLMFAVCLLIQQTFVEYLWDANDW